MTLATLHSEIETCAPTNEWDIGLLIRGHGEYAPGRRWLSRSQRFGCHHKTQDACERAARARLHYWRESHLFRSEYGHHAFYLVDLRDGWVKTGRADLRGGRLRSYERLHLPILRVIRGIGHEERVLQLGLETLGCERDGEVFSIPAPLLSDLLIAPPRRFRDMLYYARET